MSTYVCLCMRTPWARVHQAPLPMGLSQQEYWSGLPFSPPGDLPNPGIEPASLASPALAGGSLPPMPPRKPYVCVCVCDTHMYIHTHTFTLSNIHMYMCVCKYIYVCINIHFLAADSKVSWGRVALLSCIQRCHLGWGWDVIIKATIHKPWV